VLNLTPILVPSAALVALNALFKAAPSVRAALAVHASLIFCGHAAAQLAISVLLLLIKVLHSIHSFFHIM